MEVQVNCVYCHQDFNMADNLIERKISVDEKLVLTILVCPHCLNEIITQVDNNSTLQLHQRQLNLLRRMGRTAYHTGKPTELQQKKQDEIMLRLHQEREELKGKYDHTSYQFDGKEHKLDIHVPNMKISED